MSDKKFKTVVFGYDKNEVDTAIAKMRTDMDTLVEDSKNKIKQAQKIAMQANETAEKLRQELDTIKKDIENLKKSNK